MQSQNSAPAAEKIVEDTMLERAEVSGGGRQNTEGASSFKDDFPVNEGQDVFEKKTIRKIDARILIILGVCYAVSLIDRTNISSARVAGMAADLKLTVGERYSIISCIFFAPYIVFEIPSNLCLRKFGPRIWLSTIIVLWGSVMLAMGFVKTWQQLAACRVLLGILESGFYPGCVFLISCWYTRFETQKRLAAQYLLSLIFNGFGSIMSYGMSTLAGTHGLNGWQWIFIIWGCITLGLGVIFPFLVADFPDTNKFLKPEETKFVLDRLNKDRQDAEQDKITLKNVLRDLGDAKLWAISLCHCCSTLPAYSIAFFLPVILAGGGFSHILSLVLPGPPYIFAAIFVFASAYLSDRYRQRATFIALNSLVCLVGVVLMAWGKVLGVRYFGAFLNAAGCSANVPATLAYAHTNIRGQSKRAVATGIVIAGGGMGGIFASLVYRQADYPDYIPGLSATIGCQVLIWILLCGLSLHLRRRNRQADATGESLEGSVSFRYTL